MKKSSPILTIAASILLLCSGCAPIKLNKTSPGTTVAATGATSNPNAPPPITGDWNVSFMYANNAFESPVTFSQKNKQLAGQGRDASTGKEFFVTGTVDGTKVHFVKKYAQIDPNSTPVDYTGDLEYENDSEYRGWKMGGHYTTTLNGQAAEDKWVAIPMTAEAVEAPQDQGPVDQGPPQDQAPVGENGPNVSGQWSASYTHNFKKVITKLWLEQDGGSVTGHGVDTNTNEHFVVVKGWYRYPKLTLKCKYTKGKQAAQSRELTIQATVGSGPTLSGETQHGGTWHANLMR